MLSESHDVQAASYTVILCLKCQKLHWHTSQQAHKCSHGVSTPHLLEIDQSDVTICAWVKVNGYYTVDCSSWNCVHLTTVSSKHKSLNQSKHLDSIIPCWKPLIVNLQSTLSKAVQSAEHNRHTGHLRSTLPFELSVWCKQKQVHSITMDSSKHSSGLDHVNMQTHYKNAPYMNG